MEVKAGYINTELYVIPSDWKVVSLGELFDFKNGLNKAKKYFGYGTPIVNYVDVYEKRGLSSKDILGKVLVSKQEINTYKVLKGDVFFTRTSETVDEVGLSSVILDNVKDTVFSGFILRARPKNDKLETQYKKYCFSTKRVRQEITSKSSYTTRALTNGNLLSKVKIAIPPTKAEQNLIALTLSDTDALISSLEKLISKKKAIKQGTMQQLLAGKKRLPEFSGDWEMKLLGDVCRITTGKKDVNEGNPDGQFPFFTCSREHTYSDSYSFDIEAILIAGNGDVGNLHYFNGKFEAYQRTYILSEFSGNVSYLWQQLSVYLADSLGLGKIGTSIPYIKKDNLLSFAFNSPMDKAEQTAIVNVLSDMDAEIEVLERKLSKYRLIKQGMMQELLTAKKRLI